MKVKVLGDRVLVRMTDAKESITAGGIVMPSSLKKSDCKGEVISIGAGRLNTMSAAATPVRLPLEVKVGDIVVFGPNAGVEFECNGEKLKVLSESEIYAIIGEN